MTKPSTVARCVLAAALAVLVELIAFWFTGYDLGFAVVGKQLLFVLCVGALTGILACVRRTETVAARLWLAGPSLIVISPLLARRFGAWTVLFSVSLLILWSLRERAHRSASVLVASVAGSILAVRLGLFLVRDYAGRETAWRPLIVVGVTVIISSALYLGFPGSRYRQTPSNTKQLAYGFAIVIGSILLVVASTGSSLPNSLDSRDGSVSRAPIVLIVLDTVRADHLELYGYERDTMPGLSAFAREEAVVADRAITNAPDSLAAHASLFTGLFPASHGAHRPLLDDPSPPAFGYPLRPDVPTLATVLRDTGYATVGISGNFGPLGSAELGLSRGFDVYRANPNGDCSFQRRSPWSPLASIVNVLEASCIRYRRAEHITNEAIAALDLMEESNFFLFVNYMDAHSPYAPPEPFVFGGAESGEHGLSDFYDGELLYLDTHLRRLLEHLRQHPAWDDMVVLVTSDHGEGFGEHGLLGHSSSLYDEMIRVPLVFRFGRRNSVEEDVSLGRRWHRPMQSVDVMPMILGHVGVALPPTDGHPLDSTTTALRAWSFPSLAKLRANERFRRELRSVEIAGWKLIVDDEGVVELYDLDNDPRESRNLAREQPARVASMQAQMGARPVYRSTNIPTERDLSTDTIERLREVDPISWTADRRR